MRKPRDFDSELKALSDKTKLLQTGKLHQLGELVIAIGADALSVEQLAGLLLDGMESEDPSVREGWRQRGAVFFQRTTRAAGSAANHAGSTLPDDGGTTTTGS